MIDKVKSGIKNVNHKIKEIRVSRGLTQSQMADKLNIAPRVYQYWESGEKEMKVGTLIRLGLVLNCNPGDFFQKAKTISSKQGRPKKQK
jgi:transcriptional regulator with XRE-family HTH domain